MHAQNTSAVTHASCDASTAGILEDSLLPRKFQNPTRSNLVEAHQHPRLQTCVLTPARAVSIFSQQSLQNRARVVRTQAKQHARAHPRSLARIVVEDCSRSFSVSTGFCSQGVQKREECTQQALKNLQIRLYINWCAVRNFKNEDRFRTYQEFISTIQVIKAFC